MQSEALAAKNEEILSLKVAASKELEKLATNHQQTCSELHDTHCKEQQRATEAMAATRVQLEQEAVLASESLRSVHLLELEALRSEVRLELF